MSYSNFLTYNSLLFLSFYFLSCTKGKYLTFEKLTDRISELQERVNKIATA